MIVLAACVTLTAMFWANEAKLNGEYEERTTYVVERQEDIRLVYIQKLQYYGYQGESLWSLSEAELEKKVRGRGYKFKVITLDMYMASKKA